ncbi:hypothetical protein ACQGR0_11060, partial [Bacillus sp. GMa5/2]
MAYESINRLKKYMQKKIDAIVTGEKVTFNINAHQLLDEINEMERKAKAFDEIREIEKTSDITGYYENTQSYMHDVESVIEKYLEDKQND